jgi:hypothetical protein
MGTVISPENRMMDCVTPDISTLHVSVLGPPIIRVGTQPVGFRTRKEFALLTLPGRLGYSVDS